MIDVRNLEKSYGSFPAVRGLTFNAQPGEIVGLLGPNGAGKTTVMKVLTGYHFPSGGSILVNGWDVVEEPIKVKASVGYLPETSPVYGEFTVTEYLEFIAEARTIPQKERKSIIERVIAECGLGKMRQRRIEKLSKGFRQRTGLAQAILHDPPILILDEPTSGLDPNQILEIRDLIRKLGKKKTVLLSTHILQEVEAVCDRVLILNEGRLAAEGTTQEIAARMKGGDRWHISLRAPEDLQEEAVESIHGFDSLYSFSRKENGLVDIILSLNADEAEGEQIFDWAAGKGLKLRSFSKERFSLEDIFVKLTKEGSSDA